MTQRASQSLVAVLIRVGLLLALVIMLMAENAMAASQPKHISVHTQPGTANVHTHAK
jgi:hypothetical protein